MTQVVSLLDVVGEIQIQNDESAAYINRETGELCSIENEVMSEIEEGLDVAELDESYGWERDYFQKAAEIFGSEDWLKLPRKRDMHDWKIMEDFCYECTSGKTQERLLRAISGRGAFRMFRDSLSDAQEKEWYRFRDHAYGKVASEWLEENGIEFKFDLDRHRSGS